MEASWKHDIGILSDVNTAWSDKLYVHGGLLRLDKGWYWRVSAVVGKPAEVAAYLDALINFVANDIFKEYEKNQSDDPEYYEKIADLNRDLKCCSRKVGQLEKTFTDHTMVQRFKLIRQRINTLQHLVKRHKDTLSKPPLDQRPPKHVDYDLRTQLSSLKASERVPVAEIVAAAKKALALALPSHSLSAALTVVDTIKENIEKWVWGAVSTPTCRKLYENNNHLEAYQRFSHHLLQASLITEERAAAFAELAPHVKQLDLSSANPEEVFQVDHPVITPKAFEIVLNAAATSPTCSKIIVSANLAQMPMVSEFLSKNGFVLSSGQTYCLGIYIKS